MAATLGARCAKHPDVAAVAPCARCGTFLCGACTEVVKEGAWCADCVTWLRQNGSPSRLIQVFIGLGIGGVFCFPLCSFLAPLFNFGVGVLGLWLSTRELRRIQRGEGPVRGAWQAKVARALAGVNLLVMLLWAAVFLYAWAHDAGA